MNELYATCKINDNGRVVIPAEFRKQLGLNPGDAIVMTLEDGVLKMEPQRARVRRVQDSLNKLIPAAKRLSEELIENRREEVRQEMEEWLG
jgi:AbrB family looped-hinge helix DNA binding protein